MDALSTFATNAPIMSSAARKSNENDHPKSDHPPPTMTPHSLSKAVIARRSDYIRPQTIKIKIGSWNVAACPGTEKDLGGWFVEGKGMDKRLAGLRISEGIDGDHSQDNIESVDAQEARQTKKEPIITRSDEGIIVGGEDIGLYVLGLQEVVDLASTREYISKVYTDPGPANKWRNALVEALPKGYQLVVEHQLSGLLLFIFASPTVFPTITSVSTVSVGTGIMGYLGNKGAVITRLLIGETTRLVFVNSHLASGNDAAHLERRCWDVTQILQRTRFDPIDWGGVLDDHHEGIGDEDFTFWFGDLNFRLDGLPGDDIRRLLMLHTQGEYDIVQNSRNRIEVELGEVDSPIIIHHVDSDEEDLDENSFPTTGRSFNSSQDYSSDLPDPDEFVQDPSQDPTSLQATLDSLLPHDQLRQVQRKNKAFHDGWREGLITFLPTYKYDVGSIGVFDSSDKKRAPSWCDRILFRTRKDKTEYEDKHHEEELAKKKDEELKARGIDKASDDEDVLFDYNPEDDGEDQPPAKPAEEDFTTGKDFYDDYDEGEDYGEELTTKGGFVDTLRLDVYTSHQRVLSSDHKPLDAVFTLDYDAVDVELKKKIQQEVARELDKVENEGRPGITIVVDRSHELDDAKQDKKSSGTTLGSVEGVNFGPVSFQRRVYRSLTIANTSQTSSSFAFVERPGEAGEDDRIAPPWLSVTFSGPDIDEDKPHLQDINREVTLEPGDAINCTLEIYIDDIGLVRSLNQGTASLDDVLVLRVTNGRDHFLPVRGSWLQSCFGRSIDELIRVPEGGVRALLPRPNGEPGGPINRGEEVRWSAPRELFKITETAQAFTERVLADAIMLDSSQIPKEPAGWPFNSSAWLQKDPKIRQIRRADALDAMDSDRNLNEAFPPEVPAIEKLEIVAEVLVLWLSSITDGVITEALWAKIDADITARGSNQLTDVEETKAWVLDVLSASPNHNISFVFLTSMLARMANELAPLPKTGWRETYRAMGSIRRSLSLSWKNKPPPAEEEAKVAHRQAVEKGYADIFAGVVFRTPVPATPKEKKILEERKRYVLESFLHGGTVGR
ncbi:Endonuclease/exonuclease/phosphatase [Bisporella sp. PMI_857]|nr:Endonuclease/exonuclease/phosphatase [Bisporella sp. PMI_857]